MDDKQRSNTNSSPVILDITQDNLSNLSICLQNNTAKQIISLIQDGIPRSQSTISKELNIPKASVFHAITLLKKAHLIIISKKELSEKGKEIDFYALNQKPIVLTPNPHSFKEFFSSIVTSFSVFLFFPLFAYLWYSFNNSSSRIESSEIQSKAYSEEEVIPTAASDSLEIETFQDQSIEYVSTSQPTFSDAIVNSSIENAILFFILGGICFLCIFIIYKLISSRSKHKLRNK